MIVRNEYPIFIVSRNIVMHSYYIRSFRNSNNNYLQIPKFHNPSRQRKYYRLNDAMYDNCKNIYVMKLTRKSNNHQMDILHRIYNRENENG